MVALRSLRKHTQTDVVDLCAVQDDMKHQWWDLSTRWSRTVKLIILTLIGICLISSTASHHGKISQHSVSASAIAATSPRVEQETQGGTQAGGGEQRGQAAVPQTLALPSACSLFDINCALNSAAQWAAQGIQNAIQPIIDAIDRHPGNFLSQTPICVYQCPTNDSPYQSNTTVMAFVNWSIGIVNVAVATFVALGALNIIAARQIGSLNASFIMQFLPRIALAVNGSQSEYVFSPIFS